ncbi:MAG TPA: group III truncated hemoglobin [Alphaproteobacteria bacterium]|nr:group III truncated hemoglobin [Alphaproteobacteria bacterium]
MDLPLYRPPGAPDPLDDDAIRALVEDFYGRVRRDPVLGPIFEGVIGAEGWPEHFDRLTAFWSSVMRGTGRYKGAPMRAHMTIPGLEPALFERWLFHFRATARDRFEPALAGAFVAKAERIAESLQYGLQFRPPPELLGR